MVAVKKLYSTEPQWKPHRREEGSRQNRFAGFIFVCNKDTLPDLDRRIFGLPAHHAESVRAIRRGMPLFLFNYSSRCLCGVFEATSDGGLNLDPYAWENTEQTKFMKGPESRYPAQVRVRLRFQRPPLNEETFRPVLDHFEGHKFRLELTRYQVQQLLRLFGAPEGGFFGGNVRDCHLPFRPCDCDSPRSAFRSDFDCQSECSSKGTYNAEEECIEEAPSEGCVPSDSMNLDFLSDKLGQVVLNDVCIDHLDIVQEDMLYNVTQMAGVDLNILGRNHTNLMNHYHIWNMNHSKGLDCAPNDHNECHMLRLNGNDPAVNNGLVNFCQKCSHHLLLEGGEGMFTIPPIPAQWQPLIFEAHIPALAGPRDCTGFPVHMHKVSGTVESMRSDSCLSLKQCHNEEKIKDSLPSIPETQMEGTASCLPSSLFVQLPAQSGSGKCMPVLPADGKYAQPPVDHLAESEEGERDLAVMPHLFNQPSSFPVFLMPSMPRIVPIASPIELLHLEILQFARLTRPSAETILHVESAIDSVRSCVKMLWPEADVEVFGSFASGLCLQHSDVDLAIMDAPFVPSMVNMSMSQISAFLLKEIGSFLKFQKWCMNYNVIDTASVPVLKCCYQPLVRLPDSSLSMPSISIDITIGGIRGTAYEWNQAYRFGGSDKLSTMGKFRNHHTGGGAREYVLQKIQELPALAPLVLLLKSFLHHKGLSNVYLGGLGSFSLTLLITFYLERAMEGLFEDFHAESVLPTHFDIQNLGNGPDYNFSLGEYYVQRAAKAVEKVLALSESSGIHCLGTLLLGFLNFFGSEDLTCQKIVLKGLDGSLGGKRQRRNRHIALWIDDPLHPGINVGAGSFGMSYVQDSFREMLQVLIYRKLPVVPLCCSKIDCRDLAAFGQLPQLRQLVLHAESW